EGGSGVVDPGNTGEKAAPLSATACDCKIVPIYVARATLGACPASAWACCGLIRTVAGSPNAAYADALNGTRPKLSWPMVEKPVSWRRVPSYDRNQNVRFLASGPLSVKPGCTRV